MNNLVKKRTLAVCECGMLLALGFVLDYLCGLFKGPWVAGGGITLGMVPIVYIALRHGNLWGLGSALVYSGIQLGGNIALFVRSRDRN